MNLCSRLDYFSLNQKINCSKTWKNQKNSRGKAGEITKVKVYALTRSVLTYLFIMNLWALRQLPAPNNVHISGSLSAK